MYWVAAQILFMKMSSSDLRSFNSLLTINERSDARQAELQKLLFRRRKIMNNISQLKNMLVIHRILPREIISYIFVILRAEKVPIPHNKDTTPPQITVSHVCSKWREIALATPAPWNNVEITKPGCTKWVQVAIELLFDRVGRRGVNLALDMEQISSNKMEEIFYDIVLPLHVKKLHLVLPLSALENLSQKTDVIANIDEIALSFRFNTLVSTANQVSIAPEFLGKITSLTVLEQGDQLTLVKHLDLENLPCHLDSIHDSVYLSNKPFTNSHPLSCLNDY